MVEGKTSRLPVSFRFALLSPANPFCFLLLTFAFVVGVVQGKPGNANDNVKVVIRCRPLNGHERSEGRKESVSMMVLCVRVCVCARVCAYVRVQGRTLMAEGKHGCRQATYCRDRGQREQRRTSLGGQERLCVHTQRAKPSASCLGFCTRSSG